jgi:putative solute:sodium symporter small subunit
LASNLSITRKPKRGVDKANYVLVESVFSLNSDAFLNLTTLCTMNSPKNTANAYWRANLKLVGCLLLIWFVVSFGCGILFKEDLDQFSVGGAPLGFWMAQQGSIICFVLLLIAYAFFMNKLDKEHGYDEEEED